VTPFVVALVWQTLQASPSEVVLLIACDEVAWSAWHPVQAAVTAGVGLM
jgi:hypothetical protein